MYLKLPFLNLCPRKSSCISPNFCHQAQCVSNKLNTLKEQYDSTKHMERLSSTPQVDSVGLVTSGNFNHCKIWQGKPQTNSF